MNTEFKRNARRFHFWAALIISLPLLIVILSGLVLQVKKEFDWVQPPTQKGQGQLTLSFDEILQRVKTVPQAEISQWDDIDRMDVRPGKGIIKVQANNRWEVQLDGQSGEILHVAYRRSDFFESLHDGSWFHDAAKIWLFLPAAIITLLMWITGLVMLIPALRNKQKRRKKLRA